MITQDKKAPYREKGGAWAAPFARGAVAASITGLVFLASPAHQAVAADNPFTLTFGKDNPLKAPIGLNNWQYAKPAFADIDADGDMDLFIGGEGVQDPGYIVYYENTGTPDAPDFTKRIGTDNPFDGLPLAEYSAPAFADIDGDGDLDALVGGEGLSSPGLAYFENTGTVSAPVFTLRTGTANPFDAAAFGYYYMVPTFADIDNDGDIDAIVGESGDSGNGYGSIHYFENITTETDTMPVFNHVLPSDPDNPFYNLMTYTSSFTAPSAFADIDNDGDIDLFGGENSGSIHFLENLGAGPLTEGPDFADYTRYDTENPFYMVDVDYWSAPAFADLDNDGDLDGIIGSGEGDLTFFENTGSNAAPVFIKRIGKNSPFSGFDVGGYSRPVFADIDGDGDMDMVSGGEARYDELGEAVAGTSFGSNIDFFENTGTTSAPVFEERLDEDNPFNGVTLDENSYDFVALTDIDDDGDMDLFVGGEEQDLIDFYENVGTATAPVFEKRAQGDNPLFFVNTSNNSAIKFVDIDGDGDMDAFVSGQKYGNGRIDFYENVGTATAPRFTPAGHNPLGTVLAGTPDSNVYSLAFVDIDGDGDMDAVVGEEYETNSEQSEDEVHGLRLYENTGSATGPVFARVEAADAVFEGLSDLADAFYYNLTPTFVDIDGDGDMDAFAGEYYGTFLFFENHTTEPTPGGGGTTADDLGLSETNGDSCFIDTTRSDAVPGIFTQTAKRVYDAVTALIR